MSGEVKMVAVVRDTEHNKRVVQSVQKYNAMKSFCDVCFVCARGHKIYAHKLVFSTVSPFLKKIFLEVQDHLQIIYVHLPDIERSMMELLLDFLYEGSVKVNQKDYKNFQATMDTVGVTLVHPEQSNQGKGSNDQQFIQTSQVPVPQQQQIQPAPLVYMPTTSTNQGQVQYVLSPQNQFNQTQMMQAPLMTQQSNGQMVQSATQILGSPVVPMNQVVGGQMLHCSSQMVVQGSQQNLVNSNHFNSNSSLGIQPQVASDNYTNNQPSQQSYIMSSQTTNHIATNQTTTRYTQPQPTRPALASNQHQRPTHISNEHGEQNNIVETIKSILQESSSDADCLTARKIRENLEQRLDMDLVNMQQDVGYVMQTFGTGDSVVSDSSVNNSLGPVVRKSRGSRRLPYCGKSDDELDEDFNPLSTSTRARKKKVGRPRGSSKKVKSVTALTDDVKNVQM